MHTLILSLLYSWAGWFLHEKLNLNVGVGTAITLAGVFIVNNEFRKQIKSNGKH
jgi:drug/metabolite transporter (DMT)-like permease